MEFNFFNNDSFFKIFFFFYFCIFPSKYSVSTSWKNDWNLFFFFLLYLRSIGFKRINSPDHLTLELVSRYIKIDIRVDIKILSFKITTEVVKCCSGKNGSNFVDIFLKNSFSWLRKLDDLIDLIYFLMKSSSQAYFTVKIGLVYYVFI